MERYNKLGAAVATAELMQNKNFVSIFIINPFAKKYFIEKCFNMKNHNLYKEIIKFKIEYPSFLSLKQKGEFWLGYYHQKKYLSDKYKFIGYESYYVKQYSPEIISNQIIDNTIGELER